MSEMQGSPALLTVMAGYFNGDQIPRSTIWVEALQQISSQLILVFDNPRPSSIPQAWEGDRCSVVFNAATENTTSGPTNKTLSKPN